MDQFSSKNFQLRCLAIHAHTVETGWCSYKVIIAQVKGVLHPWTLFLKTLCIFSKNKATSGKISYGSGQKCSKELKNHSFTSVETIVVKLQWKMCENQYFPCFEPLINNHLSWWNSSAGIRFPEMLPIRSISYLLSMCCSFWEKCKNSPKTGRGCSTPLRLKAYFR